MIESKQRVKQLRWFDTKIAEKNPRGKLIDISSILKAESTSKFLRWINVIISTWIRLSRSMKYRRNFHVDFRRRIDGESTKMCPLGWLFYIFEHFHLKWFDCSLVFLETMSCNFSHSLSVIREKGKSQNGCFKNSEKRTFLTPRYAHVRVRIKG